MRCLTWIAALACLLGVACTSMAQDTAVQDAAPAIVDVATIEAHWTAVEADTGIETAVKDLLRPIYQQAVEAAKTTRDYAAQMTEYREAIESGAGRVDDLKAQLAALPTVEEAAPISPKAGVEDLQKELDARRATLAGLEKDLADADSELTRLQQRPVEISARLPEAQREAATLQEKRTAPDAQDDLTSPGRHAEWLLLGAQEAERVSEVEMLKWEQLSQSVREDLSRARRDLLSRQIETARTTLDELAALVNERLAGEAKELTSAAGQPPQELAADDEDGQALAAEVQALATEFSTVVETLQETTAAGAAKGADLVQLAKEEKFIKEQLNVGGGGEAVAGTLFDQQIRLPGRRALMQDSKLLKTRLDQARQGLVRAEGKLRAQTDVEMTFADRSSDGVTNLLHTRRNVLEKLVTQYRTLIRAQAALHGQGQEYLQKVEEVRAFLFERLFWVRSSPPLGLSTFAKLPDDIRWMFAPRHWNELVTTLWESTQRTPLRVAGILVVVAGLVLLRRRLGKALTQTGVAARRISTDSYSFTRNALVLTLLLALPLPLLLGATRWLIGQTSDPSAWLRGMGRGLQIVAWLTLWLAFLTVVCRDGGLGIAHFRWGKRAVRLFRHCLYGFAAAALPTLLILAITLFGDSGRHFDSLERVVYMVAYLWIAFLLWRLFRFSDGLFAETIREHPDKWVARLRHLWLPVLVGIPLALVVLAGAGYLMTAAHLTLELMATLGLIAGGSMLYWLLLRWFMIKERKLALAEAQEKRHARLEAAAPHEGEGESGEVVSADDDEDELDLDSIGGQTRHLLASCFIVSVLIAIGGLWSQTIPVFEVMRGVRVLGNFTLLQLGQVGLIVAVTAIIVHNLPGLLELAVLRTMQLDVGARVAISTLCQYAVVAIGLGLLFGVLKVDWSKLGWIAAALSVGLGFGLQEVVANFVSGLILLFERPVRVGDIITLEGTTGTVMRIRLRATTIMNWERQELVVPNKSLATGTILNWTLTNPVNRVLLTVGVAYGTDTERARQILLAVAQDHPQVLDDPAPMASFEGFADSSLTLFLRAYLPSMQNRLATITELHAEIDLRFAQAGIAIAFPQRDLHLRTPWPPTDESSK